MDGGEWEHEGRRASTLNRWGLTPAVFPSTVTHSHRTSGPLSVSQDVHGCTWSPGFSDYHTVHLHTSWATYPPYGLTPVVPTRLTSGVVTARRS